MSPSPSGPLWPLFFLSFFDSKYIHLEKTDIQSLSAPKSPMQILVRLAMKSVSCSLYIPLTLKQGKS